MNLLVDLPVTYLNCNV